MSHPSPRPDFFTLRDRAASFDRGLPVTSAILTRDAETGEIPAAKVRQVAHCCVRFNETLDAARSDPLDVARVGMKIPEFGDGSPTSAPWPETCPNPQCRPARHAVRSELPEGGIIQMVAPAILPEG
ncbi:MAG: hypothetical protein OXH79_01440 [Boseongicola sp.]|nr:hypothetical protein [Boseongicola sp.]